MQKLTSTERDLMQLVSPHWKMYLEIVTLNSASLCVDNWCQIKLNCDKHGVNLIPSTRELSQMICEDWKW